MNSDMNSKKGIELFKEKYGIDYNTLIHIPKKDENGIYKQNYTILYDKINDRVFSLWTSPYKHYIYIENQGFITEDKELWKAYRDYRDYIKQNVE